MSRKSKTPENHRSDWKEQAADARAKALKLPECNERTRLLELAKHLEDAVQMRVWITTPGTTRPSE